MAFAERPDAFEVVVAAHEPVESPDNDGVEAPGAEGVEELFETGPRVAFVGRFVDVFEGVGDLPLSGLAESPAVIELPVGGVALSERV